MESFKYNSLLNVFSLLSNEVCRKFDKYSIKTKKEKILANFGVILKSLWSHQKSPNIATNT